MFKLTANNSIFKHGISKQKLLFVAGFVWTFGGFTLLLRGLSMLQLYFYPLWLGVSIGVLGGILFYVTIFTKISQKHIRRIINLKKEKPCIFDFFSWKSYLLMIPMIGMGIFIRRIELIELKYLSIFYITMAMPLIISSFRFFVSSAYYSRTYEKFKR